ncbi:MAG: DUF1631 domain-containing protein [Pseudomonadota bacterium]|nr:DUF1631 domain-containing protein [Pseudomonadota bacterium]
MQGIPIRSRQILDELLDQLPWLLGDDVGLLLERLEEALGANPASIFEQPDCCRESQRILLYRRASAQPVLIDALRRKCLALLDVPGDDSADPPAPAQQARSLRLMDDDAVSEDSTLAAIARRHASSASLPLMLLAQRFGVLLAKPALSAEVLPVGPFAFGNALAEAARHIGLCGHTRVALYRLYDVEFSEQYPNFAEAVDGWLDAAGILAGLAYVPLRRGAPIATAVAHASEQDALQAVSRAADALGPEMALPAGMQAERREALMAVARFLMRHGRDSSQWSECLATADAMLDAARESSDAPEEATTWLRKAISSVGYGDGDASRLTAGLTTPVQDDGAIDGDGGPADASEAPAPRQRGVREQRCFDRLLALSPGATIAFSSGTGGFLHARLCEHLPDPARLLLSVSDGPEIMLEIDMIARLMAGGEAWTVRTPMANPGTAVASASA